MKEVFTLEHTYELDGNDETKFIGVYSSKSEVEMAIERLKEKVGFKEHQNGFSIDRSIINKDNWVEGFVSMTAIFTKDINDNLITVSAELLPTGYYQIVEPIRNSLLGEFKNQDVVRCEKIHEMLCAIERVYPD